MVFDGLKPLKSIEKQTLFLTLGHPKNNRFLSFFLDFSLFLSIFGEGEKT